MCGTHERWCSAVVFNDRKCDCDLVDAMIAELQGEGYTVMELGNPVIGDQQVHNESAERLGFHPANDSSRPVHQQIRRHFMWLDSWIIENLPEGREKSLARTELQNAAMWANASAAINLAPLEVEPGTFDNQ